MVYSHFDMCILKISKKDMFLCCVKVYVLPLLQRNRKCLRIARIPSDHMWVSKHLSFHWPVASLYCDALLEISLFFSVLL